MTVSDHFIDTLFAAGVKRVYGVVGDSSTSCGPGNLHIINGLFYCHRSRVPELAIAAHIRSPDISLNAGEVGLDSFPPENWPPVVIPFFAFRIMVGCGLVMLFLALLGSWLAHDDRLETRRWLLWAAAGGPDSRDTIALGSTHS
jgi:Cytochrome bd terminal oxidase subunit I